MLLKQFKERVRYKKLSILKIIANASTRRRQVMSSIVAAELKSVPSQLVRAVNATVGTLSRGIYVFGKFGSYFKSTQHAFTCFKFCIKETNYNFCFEIS